MLAFPAAIRIFVAVAPVDMRRQYDGLWAAAQQQLGEDPKQGAVFCFTNKQRTRLKLLYWDGTGVWVLAKRLEQGRFSWPAPSTAQPKRKHWRCSSAAWSSNTARSSRGMSAEREK